MKRLTICFVSATFLLFASSWVVSQPLVLPALSSLYDLAIALNFMNFIASAILIVVIGYFGVLGQSSLRD